MTDTASAPVPPAEESIAVPIKALSLAVLTLAHASQENPLYDAAYKELSRLVDAAVASATPAAVAPQQAVPAGYKLVPTTPTEEMFVAFAETWFSKVRPIDDCGMEDCYAAMLAAAPVAAIEQPRPAVPMRSDTFTVIPQNMRAYPMSVRVADIENDLYREAFDAARAEDQVTDPREVMLSHDFFKYGWEAAVQKLAAPVAQEGWHDLLTDLTKAMRAYEMAADDEPPYKHRQLMERATAMLAATPAAAPQQAVPEAASRALREVRKQQADPNLAGPGATAHECFLYAELERLHAAVTADAAAPVAAIEQPAADDLRAALIELTSVQRKLIDANAEIAALTLAAAPVAQEGEPSAQPEDFTVYAKLPDIHERLREAYRKGAAEGGADALEYAAAEAIIRGWDLPDAPSSTEASAQQDDARKLNNSPCPFCGKRIGSHTQVDWEACTGQPTPEEPEEPEEAEEPDGEASAQVAPIANVERVNTLAFVKVLGKLLSADRKRVVQGIAADPAWLVAHDALIAYIETLIAARVAGAQAAPFQARVQPWMMACFGEAISTDTVERNHRFFEEATELVQACGMPPSDAHMLVDYVYGRPVGDKPQEVGGVMVTLAALCLAQGMDLHEAAETELARIWTKVDLIRAKQAAKPKGSPLPVATEGAQAAPDAVRDAALAECVQIAESELSNLTTLYSSPLKSSAAWNIATRIRTLRTQPPADSQGGAA
jgi:hypothetical protein